MSGNRVRNITKSNSKIPIIHVDLISVEALVVPPYILERGSFFLNWFSFSSKDGCSVHKSTTAF